MKYLMWLLNAAIFFVLFAFALIIAGVGLFFATALAGRVFCGFL